MHIWDTQQATRAAAQSCPLQSCWPWMQGEGGYLRITRKVNDCGVASEPVYVELRPQGRA